MDQHVPHGIEPIVEDDDKLRWALADAHIPAMMNAIVQMTGSPDIIRGDIKPWTDNIALTEDGLSEEERQVVRDAAFDALKVYRDRGCALPQQPDHDLLLEMMEFVAGEPWPEGNQQLLEEELALFDEDPRQIQLSDGVNADDINNFHVVIIGAGMSGILAGVRLKQVGIPFTIIDKNDEATGTWYENVYPGCRVDSANHVYAYSFATDYDWPNYYSTRKSLHEYFETCIDRFGLRDHIRLGTSVKKAVFDDKTCQWHVTLQGKDGKEEALDCNAMISAVGQLNIPKMPDIKGLDTFTGDKFHSAQWDYSIPLKGRRVAVIGTGCSATQFVPEIAPDVAHLDVYQRTANWLQPAPRYHEKISEKQRWLFNHVPFYEKWYRFWLFRKMAIDGVLPALGGDGTWNGPENAVGPENDELRQLLTMHLAEQLKDRPDLLEKSIPNYPPGGKRPVADNGAWTSALKRDNVALITEPIDEIVPEGIRTKDGIVHEADVLICGTGFRADHFLWPMEVVGHNGVHLGDVWADAPRAYKGITVPGFPNLFILYGPNTNIVTGSSIIFFSECEMRYIGKCLDYLLSHDVRAMDVRQDVHDRYNDWVDAYNAKRAWGVPHVKSWYKNDKGHVTQNWPGTHLEFWRETKDLNPADYKFL